MGKEYCVGAAANEVDWSIMSSLGQFWMHIFINSKLDFEILYVDTVITLGSRDLSVILRYVYAILQSVL